MDRDEPIYCIVTLTRHTVYIIGGHGQRSSNYIAESTIVVASSKDSDASRLARPQPCLAGFFGCVLYSLVNVRMSAGTAWLNVEVGIYRIDGDHITVQHNTETSWISERRLKV